MFSTHIDKRCPLCGKEEDTRISFSFSAGLTIDCECINHEKEESKLPG